MCIRDSSEVAGLLERLEERYDRENNPDSEPTSDLSPMVEEFLQGLGSNTEFDDELDLDDDPDDE